MPLGTEVCLSPGDFVLHGDPPPARKGEEPPNFRLMFIIQGGTEETGLFTFVVHVLYLYNKIPKYDNLHVAPRTLVKEMLNVSCTGCNNDRQSFAKLSYSAIDNVLTNLLLAGLQDFFQVLSVSNATTTVSKLSLTAPQIG